LANFPVAYCGLKIIASLRSVSLIFSDWMDALHYIGSDSSYNNAFYESYARSATKENVSHAIAEFERSLLTPNGPFDRYLKGDSGAIDMPTKRGYQLFKSFGCASCHQGVAVGGNVYEKLGVVIPYYEADSTVKQDLGRYHLSGVDEDKFEFRVPSLRNVARTAPYLHDGSIETLEEVVMIMAKHQLGRVITEKEVTEIVKFLHSLNGELSAN
jgi:cytochrome c peroxidase